jgi:biotin operon repressor
MTKTMILASLLGDNPDRSFSHDELRLFIKSHSREAIYKLVRHLRRAGMNIEIKNNTVKYICIQS